MPSPASLAAGQYYAHPRNLFWTAVAEAVGVPASAPYRRRCADLRRAGIALWDVLAECRRAGSSDSAISPRGRRVRDIARLLRAHPTIRFVLLNGAFAAGIFRREIAPRLGRRIESLRVVRLPSTSPAAAAVSRTEKLRRWRRALERALGPRSRDAVTSCKIRCRRRRS